MVEGLAEREYLRDTVRQVCERERRHCHPRRPGSARGRVADTTAEATLMFTDIEGFTGLSRRLAPAEVASDPQRLSRHRGAGDPAPWRRGQQLHRRRPVRQLQPAAAAARTMPPPPSAGRARHPAGAGRPIVRRRRARCAPASASTPGTVIGVTDRRREPAELHACWATP